MPAVSFEEVWQRVVNLAGNNFYTITGLEFTYQIDSDGFYPSRTTYRVTKKGFEKAYKLLPISGPGVINNLVRGPAYVWAVLHDKRVSMGNW